jgi:two-component system sensor histidine kinase DesK
VETTGAERALARMRRYTSSSLVGIMGFFVLMIVVGSPSVPLAIALLVVGAGVTYYTSWWERPPPLWLTILVVTASAATWTAEVFLRVAPVVALILFFAAMVPISQARRRRTALAILATALGLLPVGIAAIVWPTELWWPWAVSTLASSAAAVFLFFLNRYAWGLYLEIDAARRLAGDLAVVQERYRFATDLHDIQGHTLHVLRLKTQLASRLLEQDPVAARAHLAEADALIAETLANTRSLAFGDRRVTLASEVANARSLFEAAGIGCEIEGEPTPGPHEELFGLVVREATTNILRHAQPTRVTMLLTPQRIVITNDGSPASGRSPSGLARLAERLTAVGGSLRTSIVDGIFTTEAATA